MKRKRAPLKRSEVMSRVRARDTRPEMRIRRALHTAGLRYRLHAKDLPGRPDIVFRRVRLAIFVHGCFWHRHPECEHARMPKTRLGFWRTKLKANVARDARQVAELEAAGWTVLTLWECETRDATAVAMFVENVARRVRGNPAATTLSS